MARNYEAHTLAVLLVHALYACTHPSLNRSRRESSFNQSKHFKPSRKGGKAVSTRKTETSEHESRVAYWRSNVCSVSAWLLRIYRIVHVVKTVRHSLSLECHSSFSSTDVPFRLSLLITMKNKPSLDYNSTSEWHV